ncbi:hypothetical protein AXF42_Ash017429 [Apostasia shenzhenica]|uniref:Uncharacterized protein n=1 Tax=Apostasia shenzhenica TaxID=1088818 RepID=A0A2H9ZYZ8_9ASPA|nr:hypothetical protein AXF42_Ash017429 [Apostasia shenzhenica]
MGESSASYIHMVQHLIEKCLVYRMSKEECVDALSKHANIKPVITSTVWGELEKENREFFAAYGREREQELALEAEEAMRRVEKMLADRAGGDSGEED